MTPIMIVMMAALGPLFAVLSNSDDDDIEQIDETVPETQTPTEETGDLLDLVEFESRPEEARDGIATDEPFQNTRGTDQAAEFTGDDTLRNIHDASGGEDTLTGGALDDVLIGGEDADLINGGDGDDDLFGGFQRETRADDLDADTLNGGNGDDTLFLGNGDTAIGGTGADAFVLVQDTTGAVTIEDFNPAEDAILIEDPDPTTLDVEDQTVVEDNLLITLTTGATITLNDVSEPLDENLILFVAVDPLDTITTT